MFIPGYDNERIIARGGFATVYRARQRTFQRDVAVKVLELSVGEKRDRRRVERESAAMGRLTGHPHIVWVLDSGFTDDGRPYLTTPFYRRGSLTRRLEAHGPLGLPEVLHAGVAIAGALEAAHRHGILHRDVKPGNILISPYGEPALMDFGIASLTQAETDADPSQNTQAFSVEHAAPEIFDGSPGSVSADVYALCSTLWMLLAGQAAFAPETDEGIARTIYRVQREPVPALERDDVPESLAGLLRQGMAKDPGERPASARAFGQALQLVQTELGIPVTPLRVADRDEETGDEEAVGEDAVGDAAAASDAPAAADQPGADTPEADRPSPALPSGPDITTITAFGGAMPAGDSVPRAAPPAKPAPWQGRMTKWDLLTPAARAASSSSSSDGGTSSGGNGGSSGAGERAPTTKSNPDPERTAANERAAKRTARQVSPRTGPPDDVTDVVAVTALEATTVLPPSGNGDHPVPTPTSPAPPNDTPEGPRAEPPDDRTAPVATTPPAPGEGNGNENGNGRSKAAKKSKDESKSKGKTTGDGGAPTVVLSDLPPPPPSATAPTRQAPVDEALPPPPPTRQAPVDQPLPPPPPPPPTTWPRSSTPAADAVKPRRTRRQAPALGPTILLIIAALLALVIMFVAFAINRRDADLETVSSASSDASTTVAETRPTAPPPTTVAPPPTVATTAATAPAPTTAAPPPPVPQPIPGGPVVATDDPAVQQAAAVAQRAGTALADGRWGDARQLIQGLSASDAENIRGWGGLDAVTMVVTDARNNGDGSVTMRLGEIAHETVGGQRTSLYCVTWTVQDGRVTGMANQQVIQAPWRDSWIPPAEAVPIVQSQCSRL